MAGRVVIIVSIWIAFLLLPYDPTGGQLLPLSSFQSLVSDTYSILNTSTYNKKAQPSSVTHLYLRLSLMTLNEINIKEQSMSVTGYLTMIWFDERLNTSSSSSSLDLLTVDQSDVWKPTIIVQNALKDVEPIHSPYSPVLLANDGKMSWSIMKIFQTSCSIDSTYYPFDVQTCTVSMTTWGATSNQVIIQNAEPFFTTINLDPYQENGLWILEDTSYRLYLETRENQKYSNIEFALTFKRRSQFYVMIIMIPVCLLSFLICSVFVLPPESGEKIGFSLTVLLSFAVYLSLISDDLPETSLTLSILTFYVTAQFSVGIFSVLMTIFVLTCHHSPENQPMSGCLRRFTFFLAKITCWKRCACSGRTAVVGVSLGGAVLNDPDEKHKECEECEKFDLRDEIGWPEVALIWDRFFLMMSLLVVVLCTFGAVVWLVVPKHM